MHNNGGNESVDFSLVFLQFSIIYMLNWRWLYEEKKKQRENNNTRKRHHHTLLLIIVISFHVLYFSNFIIHEWHAILLAECEIHKHTHMCDDWLKFLITLYFVSKKKWSWSFTTTDLPRIFWIYKCFAKCMTSSFLYRRII